MPALLRSNEPRGARFYEDGDKVMFVNRLDSATCFGPHEATEEDMAGFPEELDRFLKAAPEREPFSPMVTFETPADAKIPEPTKAKGERAPV